MGLVDGKVAIVTGATSGIGARTVDLFVEEGARVVYSVRSEAGKKALADLLQGRPVFVCW